MRSRMQNVLTFSKIKQQDYCTFTSVFWIYPRYPEYISGSQFLNWEVGRDPVDRVAVNSTTDFF